MSAWLALFVRITWVMRATAPFEGFSRLENPWHDRFFTQYTKNRSFEGFPTWEFPSNGGVSAFDMPDPGLRQTAYRVFGGWI
jgi:hypothetical protein